VPEPLHVAVRRAGPFGEHDDGPTLADQLFGLVDPLPALGPVDREARVDERGERLAPPHVEEVIAGGADGGPALPAIRQRAQDQGRVEMARVVREEHDRSAHVLQMIEPVHAERELVANQRVHDSL
jgi:hypothetical protein